MTEGNFLNNTFSAKVFLVESLLPSGIKLSSLEFLKWRMYYLHKTTGKNVNASVKDYYCCYY